MSLPYYFRQFKAGYSAGQYRHNIKSRRMAVELFLNKKMNEQIQNRQRERACFESAHSFFLKILLCPSRFLNVVSKLRQIPA